MDLFLVDFQEGNDVDNYEPPAFESPLPPIDTPLTDKASEVFEDYEPTPPPTPAPEPHTPGVDYIMIEADNDNDNGFELIGNK